MRMLRASTAGKTQTADSQDERQSSNTCYETMPPDIPVSMEFSHLRYGARRSASFFMENAKAYPGSGGRYPMISSSVNLILELAMVLVLPCGDTSAETPILSSRDYTKKAASD